MTTESILIIDYTDENGEKRMQRVRFPIDSTYEDFTNRLATRLGKVQEKAPPTAMLKSIVAKFTAGEAKVTTKSWQTSVKTDWMCKKNGAQHAFFLSYRVDTEKSFSQTLAHALDAGVRSSVAIHAGEEWIESFITGLWNSVVFVPVCSDAAMRKMKTAHETPDNMLLEWEIALDIRDKKLRDISVFPVLVGEYLTVAVPDPVMGTRDRRVLATFSSFAGFPDAYHNHPYSPRTRKIKDTISEILKYQGVRADPDIVDPTAGDLLRMWNALKPGAAAPTHFHEANAMFDDELDACAQIYLAYFLPYYDSVREEVEDRNTSGRKPAFAVVWQEPNTAKVRYEKFQRFGDAATFYDRVDEDAPRVLADKNGDIWMCHLEAGEIGRIHVLRHLEGLVQLSSPAAQHKYIFSCHYGSAQSTTFPDFASAHGKFDEIGDGFARVISDTAGRIYLSYFFPVYDSTRTEVMECHYEKIYSSKDYAIVYHHPDKGVQTERFSDYNKALERYDTLNLAKLLRDGNGHIYDSYFVPDYTHIRDEVMVFSNGLQL
ncbi:hypothetical protein BC829DRAFT_385301 [Chytridium lagenaria]|nr:hypothetical protein BC829DRAFT_385301 [Chytridium lagenaria]